MSTSAAAIVAATTFAVCFDVYYLGFIAKTVQLANPLSAGAERGASPYTIGDSAREALSSATWCFLLAFFMYALLRFNARLGASPATDRMEKVKILRGVTTRDYASLDDDNADDIDEHDKSD
jgi:hypothetical protein